MRKIFSRVSIHDDKGSITTITVVNVKNLKVGSGRDTEARERCRVMVVARTKAVVKKSRIPSYLLCCPSHLLLGSFFRDGLDAQVFQGTGLDHPQFLPASKTSFSFVRAPLHCVESETLTGMRTYHTKWLSRSNQAKLQKGKSLLLHHTKWFFWTIIYASKLLDENTVQAEFDVVHNQRL